MSQDKTLLAETLRSKLSSVDPHSVVGLEITMDEERRLKTVTLFVTQSDQTKQRKLWVWDGFDVKEKP